MEIKSTMKSRLLDVVPVVYRDIDSFEYLRNRTVHGVHAFCFVGDQLVIVFSEKKGYWTPPGGGVEPGETVEEAIVREVLEETNMRVLKQRVIGYQEVSEPHRLTVQVRSVCIVEPVGPFVTDADPEGDVTEIKLIDPKDIKQYFDWGEVGEHVLARALELKNSLRYNPLQRDGAKLEEEVKLAVQDIPAILVKIRSVAKYVRTEYLRDVIYGTKDEKKKIRLRIQDNFEFRLVDATYKYRVAVEDGVKKEIEETLYKGNSFEDARKFIALQGDFVEENSYEKIRTVFIGPDDTEITLDIYPYGAWIEIEGETRKIHEVAKRLGFTQKDYIDTGADDLYLAWIKKHNLPEMWDVRFGLGGKK